MKIRKKRKIIILTVLAVVTLVIGSVGIYTLSTMKKISRVTISQKPEDLGIDNELFEDSKKAEETESKPESTPTEDVKPKNITNIALFGVDAPKGEAGRSDTIMIFTIDEFHKKLKLTSIMRDSYVNIEGHGMDKINHAYAFGGPQLAIKTINQNFKLNVKDFLLVNFSTLPQIVDTLGGVQMDIKDYEVSSLQGEGINAPGTYTLNGNQTLSYSRIRYVGNGDYERTERQRTVLKAVFSKMVNSDKAKLPSMIQKLFPMIETSLSNTDIVSLGSKTLDMDIKNLELQRFPLDAGSTGKMINSIWYLTFDLEAASKQVFSYIFEDKNP